MFLPPLLLLLQEHLPKGSSPLVSISLFAPWSFAFLLPVALYNEPGGLLYGVDDDMPICACAT